MLHAKFQDHITSGSREDFLNVLAYTGVAAVLVKDLNHFYKLLFSLPKEASHKIWL